MIDHTLSAYYRHMAFETNPGLFDGLTEEDVNDLSISFWQRCGDIDRRLYFKQKFSWRYPDRDFLNDSSVPTLKEKRRMYKSQQRKQGGSRP